MRKKITTLLIILFIAIVSVNCVSAWWFSFECDGFTLDQPNGVEVANGYRPQTPPTEVELVEDLDNDIWDFHLLTLSEVPLTEDADSIDVVENITKDGISIVKGNRVDISYVGDSEVDLSYNASYAEFDKDGKHFYLLINHNYEQLDNINLTKDLQLTKEIQKQIKVK